MKKFQNDIIKTREFIILIEKFFEEIVQDPYGNYVIQHAFEVEEKI